MGGMKHEPADEISQPNAPDEPPLTEEDQYAESVELTIVLVRLNSYCNGQVSADDLGVFDFSLHHLFYSISALYREVLPDLTVAGQPVPESQDGIDDLLRLHRIWTRLQMVKHLLGKIEPLCHLLNNTITCILDALDAPQGDYYLHSAPPEIPTQSYQEYLRYLEDQEEWERTVTLLGEHVNDWQRCYEQRLFFTTCFAHLSTSIPSLPQADSAFASLLDAASAIFSDILLDFHAVSAGDAIAVATVLLDLMQKIDQILIQIDALSEPLHALLKEHLVGVE
jgi:hypothetical protein